MQESPREKAQKLIKDIRSGNGWISDEVYKTAKEEILLALKSLRHKLGAATRTLATSLYSKDTRCIFELIQNAEDNSYDNSSTVPYIRFTVLHTRIIIDSNEDGFKDEHVTSICSTGQSTKKTKQGYIGEKGIGFKSVFKIANRVKVQSEPFSFYFEHSRTSGTVSTPALATSTAENDEPGESYKQTYEGLGMITPMTGDYEELPEGVNTRITLELLNPMTEEFYHELFDIPDALLLFLTKLEHIQIDKLFPVQEKIITTYRYRRGDSEELADTILKEVKKPSPSGPFERTEEIENFYHVVRSNVNGLPLDAMRPKNDSATIVLAFPVDSEANPVLENQHAFAFLPLRKLNLKFLVQSDFITQASREDLFQRPWNLRILDHVAVVFKDAVLRFCEHPKMMYSWLKYLPEDNISDEFWRQLRPKIISQLSDTYVLRPRYWNILCEPGTLRFLPDWALDETEQPLFKDHIFSNFSLAPDYNKVDYPSLRALGVKTLTLLEMTQRLEMDLPGDQSRFRTTSFTEEWHERTARFLSRALESSHELKIRLMNMDLVPLEDGRWLNAKVSSFYFPFIGKSQIPGDLGLDLIRVAATQNNSWIKFLTQLGVKNQRTETVIEKIYEHLGQTGRRMTTGSHLHFLFENLPKEVSKIKVDMMLPDDEDGKVLVSGPRRKHIYFGDSNGAYSPGHLFRDVQTKKNLLASDGVHFLQNDCSVYPKQKVRFGRTYEDWLRQVVGIHRVPQLVHHWKDSISEEFCHIIENRPDRLVGLLHTHWRTYKPIILKSKEIRESLEQSMVPVKRGRQKLCEVYLPLPKLKEILDSCCAACSVSFLLLPNDITDTEELDWHFLKLLSVGTTDDPKFYLAALDGAPEGATIADTVKCVAQLYDGLATSCITSDHRDLIRKQFTGDWLVYIPDPLMDNNVVALSLEDCIWTGPEWLTVRHRVEAVYPEQEGLFRSILKLRNSNWHDAIAELQDMRDNEESDISKVLEIYEWLMHDFRTHKSYEHLRLEFKTKGLIFVPGLDEWHATSSCVWASRDVRIVQKQSIASTYGKLSHFFVEMLGIRRPDLAMHIQSLKALAGSRPKSPTWARDVKSAMLLISSMDPKPADVSELLRLDIFPVKTRQGETSYTSSRVEFAIVDLPKHQNLFPEIVTLNFSPEELHANKRLIYAMGLQKNLMSSTVQEKTMVEEGSIHNELTQRFRSRAYAIYRCAFTHDSPNTRDDNDRGFYNQLLNAEVRTSKCIFVSSTLVQNSITHTARGQKANFHFGQEGTNMTLYVPDNPDERELCYHRQLPSGLAKAFATQGNAAEGIFQSVLASSSLLIVDEILKDAGMVEVPGIRRPQQPDQTEVVTPTEEVPFSIAATLVNFNASSRRNSNVFESVPESTNRNIRPASEVPRSTNIFGSRPTAFTFRPPTPMTTPNTTPSPRVAGGHQYSDVLSRVIMAAGHTTFPTKHHSSLSSLEMGPLNFRFGQRSTDRDRKVGAAGELFVFELLSQLDLPGFGLQNWQSTICGEVSVHDKYRDLQNFDGKETADIVYDDTQRKLIGLLVEEGYISPVDEMKKTICYIEVKTTTSSYNEGFYVSPGQYRLMEQCQRHANGSWDAIYIIMRVFQLEESRIGLRVYVDPVTSRLSGELDFATERWKVTPGQVET